MAIAEKLARKGYNFLKNPYAPIGLKWSDSRRIKSAPKKDNSVFFRGRELFYGKREEVIHALDEIFVEGVYKMPLPSSPRIIDCGAHIGMSILYYSYKYPGARVTAFEPDKKNFGLLSKNVSGLNFSRLDLVQKAIWIESGVIPFEESGDMGSHISSGSAQKKPGTQVSVETCRLKDFLHEPVHFLKMDIEGAEYDVIKDIEPELANVSNAFIEYHGDFDKQKNMLEIIEIMVRAGFTFYIKEAASVYSSPFDHKSHKPEHYDHQYNLFFFRKDD